MATPVILLPCQDALLEMVDVWYHRLRHKHSSKNLAGTNNEICCWRTLHKYNTPETAVDANITTEDEVLEITMEEGQAAAAATDNKFTPLVPQNFHRPHPPNPILDMQYSLFTFGAVLPCNKNFGLHRCLHWATCIHEHKCLSSSLEANHQIIPCHIFVIYSAGLPSLYRCYA